MVGKLLDTSDGKATLGEVECHWPRRETLVAEGRRRPKASYERSKKLSSSFSNQIAAGRYRIRFLSEFHADECTSSSGKAGLTIPSNPLAPSRDGLLASAPYRRCSFRLFVDVRLVYPLSGFRKAIGFEHGFDHSSLMSPSGQVRVPAQASTLFSDRLYESPREWVRSPGARKTRNQPFGFEGCVRSFGLTLNTIGAKLAGSMSSNQFSLIGVGYGFGILAISSRPPQPYW